MNAIDRVSAPRRARRTRKLTRNNVEALEPRVLLSAHGADPSDGPHGVGLEHAAPPAQFHAEQHGAAVDQTNSDNSKTHNSNSIQINGGQVDSSQNNSGPIESGDVNSGQSDSGPVDQIQTDGPDAQPRFHFGPDPIVPFPSDGPGDSNTNLASGSDTQQPSDPAPSTGETFHLGEWSWGNWGYNGSDSSDASTGSPSTPGSDGTTVVEIIFIDPIPIGSWPNVKHPLNNGSNDGDNNPPPSTGSNGGTEQQTQQNGSTGTGTSKSPAPGNQSNPPTQGNQNESDASDSHDSNFHPLNNHGPGTPPPTYDPPGSSQAQSEITRPSTPIPVFGPALPAAKPSTGTPDSPVTPLALTPGHESAGNAQASSSSPVPFSIVPVAASHDSFTTTKAAAPDGITAMHMPSQIAASLPPAGAIARAIDAAVPAAGRAVTQQVQTAGAVVASVEAVTADAIQQSLPAQATYNFIRFDAASFHDAVAAFASDLASMTKPSASHHSTTRAWIITGTVLGMDAIFLGYWRRQVKKQKKSRLALAKATRRRKG